MTDTVKTATPPERAAGDASGGGEVKAERMPFGRWMRLVGWRHVVAVILVVWALVPAFYVVSLALLGRQHADRRLPAGPQRGWRRLSCLVPNDVRLQQLQHAADQRPVPVRDLDQEHASSSRPVNAAGALLMGAAAAFAFSRLRFRGRRMGLLPLMLVQMFPAVLAITAIYLAADRGSSTSSRRSASGSIWGTLLVYLGGAWA